MRQSDSAKKKPRRGAEDDAASSFKRLGGRGLEEREEAVSRAGERGEEDAGEDSPSMEERADAGVKVASHLRKAATGGKLRQAFSLWRVARHLPVAAAGAGGLVKRYPGATALLGGATTAGVIYLLATRAARAGAESVAQDQGEESGEADDQVDVDDAGESQEEQPQGTEEGQEEQDE